MTPSIELTCWIFLDLRTYGVPDKLVTDIGHTYQHTIAHVTSLYGVKDDFEIQAAVLWGDTLGPFFCTVELDYVLGKALQGHHDHDDERW